MYKKRMLIVIIMLLSCLFIGYGRVYAIDIDKKGIIDGIYSYDNDKISGVNIKLYKIANIDEDNNYHFLDEYKQYESDISNMSNSEWNTFTYKILDYIKDNNLNENTSTVSQIDGYFTFDDIGVGLYIIVFDDLDSGNIVYSATPVLISIPDYDRISKELSYEITIKAKIEGRKKDITPTDDKKEEINNKPNDDKKVTPNDSVNTPKTYDEIIKYIVVLIIVVIILIILIYFIKKSLRGKECKNEK